MANSGSPFLKRPGTRPGWWAVGLAIAFLVMIIANSAVVMLFSKDVSSGPPVLPNFGMLILLCGLAAGVAGLTAIIWKHERSWLVWLSILPGVLALLSILSDILVPRL
jgi:hypothetical protein